MSPATTASPAGVAIEPATPDDRLDVLRVLDAAMLETDPAVVDAAIEANRAPVARFSRTGAVVGSLVAVRPEPGRLHVDAVAVRRSRRGQGIGSALVGEAVRRAEGDGDVDVVTATFEPRLKEFYADLGFTVGGDLAVDDFDTDDRDGDDIDTDDAAGPDRLSGRRAV